MDNINLYTTYYISDSIDRQAELDYCFINNIYNNNIKTITVFVDIETANKLPVIDNEYASKLNIIILNRIPKYGDWLNTPQYPDSISVFANADIYFDTSISSISNYLNNPKSLVCLSRYDIDSTGTALPHPNPKWSQDVWAIRSTEINNITFLDKLNITMGKCRCDNSFASYFVMHGWDLYNPMNDIKSYHKHNSNIRTYNKTDTDIVGTLAFVYPCIDNRPSKIEIDIMPITTNNIISCKINSFLQKTKN